MSDTISFAQGEVALATGKVAYIEAGSGRDVVYLHHSWGNPGALTFHESLVEAGYRVVVPDMPGWGGSERPSWARTVRDIAILVGRILVETTANSPVVVGAGFGGYVALELATMSPSRFGNLVLIGNAGILPDEGEILDQMMLSHRQYIQDSFRDRDTYVQHMGEEPAPELRELWDLSREMTARVSWKPYLHNRRLQPLIADMAVPTLILWGENDKVVPLSVAHQIHAQLLNSEVQVVSSGGHLIEFEEPETVVKIISQYLATQDSS